MSMRTHSWLSQGAEALEVRLGESQDGSTFDCDVLIVGSGYGGAVAAARLAGAIVDEKPGERPASVWLVERGAEHLPGRFPSRFSELPGHVRFGMQDGRAPRGRDEGLFDLRIGPDVSALLGNGLGGGSLINAGVMERPDDAVFEKDWPAAITPNSLSDGYHKALAMLLPQKIRKDRETKKLAVLDKLAQKKGLAAERCSVTINLSPEPVTSAAGIPLASCTLCGDCMTGCNQGAKGSLDTNYLAWAHARGVEMFCGVAVETVAPGDVEGVWKVRWHYTDRELRRVQQRHIVRARHVVLAAGSLGSTEILLRSKDLLKLPDTEQRKHFSINGDAIAAGIRHTERVGIAADQESDPADPLARMVGPTITGLLRVPATAEGNAFVVEEFAVPAALRYVLGELVSAPNLFGVNDTFNDAGAPVGADLHAVTDQAIDRISLYGLMADDGAGGSLCLPKVEGAERAVEGGIRIKWPKELKPSVFKVMGTWLDEALNPAEALPSPKFLLEVAPTVHPLGGCRMADNGDSGVVDDHGRVFKSSGTEVHGGLVVLDGSIVPRALAINPALTIAALAERALPKLMDEWKLTPAKGDITRQLPLRTPARRQELPPPETAWTVRERLQGPCEIGGRHYWAQLEVEFDEVHGFRNALELTPRVIDLRAKLTLRLQSRRTDEFDDTDSSPVCCTAQLTGSVELFAPLTPPAPSDDQRSRLNYCLAVQNVDPDAAVELHIGSRLEGIKEIGGNDAMSPWRQLSEMRVSIDGVHVGRWALDMSDLAQRRDPLLSMRRLTTMPDALADLGAIGLYALRRVLPQLLDLSNQDAGKSDPSHLDQRYPRAYKTDGPKPDVTNDPDNKPPRWRLSRYKGEGRPIVLIHGLGTSGSSFTHPSITCNLARVLHEAGRDVWVLDVRSSIGNEAGRSSAEASEWTVERVAEDIPPAIRAVLANRPDHKQVDVFAHCMGAVMFCMAALDCVSMRGQVRAVVLSQVGPLVRLSPLNRLRGYVGSYLQQYFRVEEFDATPQDGGLRRTLLDALLATFPYPDGDNEARVAEDDLLMGTDFRLIRHRADAIFGQLFELRNVAKPTLEHLGALFGWVKVPMLAQAIHFARQEMLTDARGRNEALKHENFKDGFGFPVLMLHGRKNRVFDWRGSLRSLRLLQRLRNVEGDERTRDSAHACWIHGAADAKERLAVFDDYGHLDCIIGEKAHQHVFPVAMAFLNETWESREKSRAAAPPLEVEAPWIGPMLGWLQDTGADSSRRLRLKVLVHPPLRRAFTQAIVIAPITADGMPGDMDRARWLVWPKAQPRYAAFELQIDPGILTASGDTFALLTVHRDVPLEEPSDDSTANQTPSVYSAGAGAPVGTFGGQSIEELAPVEAFATPAPKADWLEGGKPLDPTLRQAIEVWMREHRSDGELEACQFSLTARALAGADVRTPAQTTPSLSFALASCQYPPGLLDQDPAEASWRRLLEDTKATDGPQFLLLAGDQVYVDAAAGLFDPVAATQPNRRDANPPDRLAADLDRIYELNWRLPAFRRLAARLPVYTMLDDHEVHDNWQGLEGAAGNAAVSAALNAYDRFQGALAPDRRLGRRDSRSYRVHPGGVPLFVLDTRSARDPRTADTVKEASIVQDDVMSALIDGLKKAPRDCVKLVLTPVPLLPPERFPPDRPAERLRSDTWSGFPFSAGTLLRTIRDFDIRHVVLLGGDSHLSSVTSFAFELPCTNRVISIVSSGTYAPWPFANQRPDEVVFDQDVCMGTPAEPCRGTVKLHAISAANGYAIITLRGTGGNTELNVSLRPTEGQPTDCTIPLEQASCPLHPARRGAQQSRSQLNRSTR